MIRTEHSGVSYRQPEVQARHMMFSFQYKARILSNNGIETARNWKKLFKNDSWRCTLPGVVHRKLIHGGNKGNIDYHKICGKVASTRNVKRRSHFQNSASV